MSEIKSCLFDLDGVIVDTARYHFQAWKRLCKELGFDLSHDENEELKGIGRAESLEILLRKGGVSLSDSEKAHYMKIKNDWYLELVDTMASDEILPGVVNFLDEVKQSGRKIALGSASKNAIKILEKVGILGLFDAVIDGTKVTRGKPDPQTFTLGAEATGAMPNECVVFEDALAGVDAALAGGMYVIGVGEPDVLNKAHKVIPGFAGVGVSLLDF